MSKGKVSEGIAWLELAPWFSFAIKSRFLCLSLKVRCSSPLIVFIFFLLWTCSNRTPDLDSELKLMFHEGREEREVPLLTHWPHLF